MTLTAAGEAILREVDDLLERERAIAAAHEQLSQDAAVQAAFNCGVATERGRILTLIQARLDQVPAGGSACLSLQALRRAIRAQGCDM